MAEKEMIYNVPLRKELLKVPRYKRTQKAVRAMREFVAKHSKMDNVKIGKYLNLKLWEHGRKNPPTKLTVKVIKDKDFATVELPDAPIEEKPEEEKKGLIGKLREKVTGKGKIEVESETPEVKKEEERIEETEKEKEEVMKSAPEKEHAHLKVEEPEKKIDTREMEEKERHKKIVSKVQKPKHEKRK